MSNTEKPKGNGHLLYFLIPLGITFIAFIIFAFTGGKSTEDTVKEKTDEDIRAEILQGVQNHERHFELVNEEDLSKEEAEYVKIIGNVPGIHRNGDLFTFVGKQGEDKLSYFEDVVKDNVLTVYIKREKGDGAYVVNLRLVKKGEYDLAYIEVPSFEELQLEEASSNKPNTQTLKEPDKSKEAQTGAVIIQNGSIINVGENVIESENSIKPSNPPSDSPQSTPQIGGEIKLPEINENMELIPEEIPNLSITVVE